MKCNHCGFENKEDAIFCSKCGEKIELKKIEKKKEQVKEEKKEEPKKVKEQVEQFCPSCGAKNKEGIKFCIHCGKEMTPKKEKTENRCPVCGAKNDKNTKYCLSCGAALDNEEVKKINKAKKQTKEKIHNITYKISIVLGCIWVISITLMVGMMYLHRGEENRKFQTKEEKEQMQQAEMKEPKEIITGDFEPVEFKLTKENENEDYDDDGLTNKEEIDAKTNVLSKDTDGDGLNDYEEVKYYKSNPNKVSTSDDGISDYAKVKKGLDVNKKYDIKDIQIEELHPSYRITLIPKDIESETKGKYESFGTDNTIRSYSPIFTVYEFEGTLKYEIDDDEDYVVLVKYNNKYEKFQNFKKEYEEIAIELTKEDSGKNFLIVTEENYNNYEKGSDK